jgi:hypothetical protein
MYRVTARRLSIYNNACVFSTVHLQIMEKIIRTQKNMFRVEKSRFMIALIQQQEIVWVDICLVRNMDHP